MHSACFTMIGVYGIRWIPELILHWEKNLFERIFLFRSAILISGFRGNFVKYRLSTNPLAISVQVRHGSLILTRKFTSDTSNVTNLSVVDGKREVEWKKMSAILVDIFNLGLSTPFIHHSDWTIADRDCHRFANIRPNSVNHSQNMTVLSWTILWTCYILCYELFYGLCDGLCHGLC